VNYRCDLCGDRMRLDDHKDLEAHTFIDPEDEDCTVVAHTSCAKEEELVQAPVFKTPSA